MKNYLNLMIAIFLVMGSSIRSEARLGLTREACLKEYGTPIKTPNYYRLIFKKNDTEIAVIFVDKHVHEMSYTRPLGNYQYKRFDSEEIVALITANCGNVKFTIQEEKSNDSIVMMDSIDNRFNVVYSSSVVVIRTQELYKARKDPNSAIRLREDEEIRPQRERRERDKRVGEQQKQIWDGYKWMAKETTLEMKTSFLVGYFVGHYCSKNIEEEDIFTSKYSVKDLIAVLDSLYQKERFRKLPVYGPLRAIERQIEGKTQKSLDEEMDVVLKLWKDIDNVMNDKLKD